MPPPGLDAVLRRTAAVLALGALLCGCASKPTSTTMSQRVGPGEGLTVAELQSEVMSFADTFSSTISQACDEVQLSTDDLDVRLWAQQEKHAMALAAFTIASEPNPFVSLLDMVVLVTLSRDTAERFGPKYYGEYGVSIIEAFRRSEELINILARKVLAPEGLAELEALIEQWRDNHPDQHYVSHVRFDDFAAGRRTMGSTVKGGGSLLGLVGLDPLARMDPATREIEQSRLLAERLAYLVPRLPAVMGWQVRVLMMQAGNSPQVLHAFESADRAVALAEALPDRLAAVVAVEREAAIEQARQAIATEREAILLDLDQKAETLGPLVTELRQTVEAGTVLATSTDALLGTVAASRRPDARPLDVAEVQATLAEATVTVRELNSLVERLDGLLQRGGGGDEMAAALALAEASGTRLINRVFLLAALLVVLIFAASMIRIAVRRRVPPEPKGETRAA